MVKFEEIVMSVWWLAMWLVLMPAVAHAQMQMGGSVETLKQNVPRHGASGTSLEPNSSAPAMLIRMHGTGEL